MNHHSLSFLSICASIARCQGFYINTHVGCTQFTTPLAAGNSLFLRLVVSEEISGQQDLHRLDEKFTRYTPAQAAPQNVKDYSGAIFVVATTERLQLTATNKQVEQNFKAREKTVLRRSAKLLSALLCVWRFHCQGRSRTTSSLRAGRPGSREKA